MDYNSYITAALQDNGPLVNIHLSNGYPADFKIPSEDGSDDLSILHILAFKGYEKSLKALLDGGANPNILDASGDPPMKMAIAEGNKRVVELLLNYGAKLDIRMSGGETLLHTALLEEQTEIAQLLMNHGADPDVSNDKGISARQIGSFRAMKAGGWDTTKPNTGASFNDNMNGLSEEGLMGLFQQLPFMIKARINSGEISSVRAAALNDLLREFEQCMNRPLEIRSTCMRGVAAKLMANMGN